MSKRERNQAIATCRCPVAGCQEIAPVFKFRARESEANRRFAGKLYLHCPSHGRVGADGAAGIQEFILEHVTWPKQNAGDPPGNPPESAIAKPSPKPAAAPAQKQPQARPQSRDLWEM